MTAITIHRMFKRVESAMSISGDDDDILYHPAFFTGDAGVFLIVMSELLRYTRFVQNFPSG